MQIPDRGNPFSLKTCLTFYCQMDEVAHFRLGANLTFINASISGVNVSEKEWKWNGILCHCKMQKVFSTLKILSQVILKSIWILRKPLSRMQSSIKELEIQYFLPREARHSPVSGFMRMHKYMANSIFSWFAFKISVDFLDANDFEMFLTPQLNCTRGGCSVYEHSGIGIFFRSKFEC